MHIDFVGKAGWRDRYYLAKMGLDRHRAEHRKALDALFKCYTEGLAWVFQYYYQGCASWSWYYPFHYAPMAGT